ncbi:MAG: membrane protein insertion efficiency factor YidD [Flavobacteriales bacterium]|nr:membrane protein insertion efficiency factor YidD [Flavobacteriales bacterium]
MVIRILIALVRAYQILLSPWLGSNCRHDPTCSRYAMEALETWGAWKGSGLTLRRISRCHPWGTQGSDPVPPKADNPS